MEDIELTNQEIIWTFGRKEYYEYLQIMEMGIIKQTEMKEKN